MIVFFPIGHEESRIRRIPFVTIGLILTCSIVLALTQGAMERQTREYETLLTQMQSLKMNAFLQVHRKGGGDLISAMVDKDASNYYELSQKFGERVQIFWQDFIQGKKVDSDDPLYVQYLELNEKLEAAKKKNLVWTYGMAPDRVSLVTLVTSLFLHGGLGHLLFNMIFLFLFGMALEDVWGRPLFAGFYFLSGFAASGMHIVMNLGSEVPCIGASGAIAGLMGAFLIRFYKSNIHFAYYYVLLKVHFGKFSVPAFVALPVWLGAQLLYALLQTNEVTAVAFWAHIGGFGFGVLGAFGLKALDIGQPSLRETDAAQLAELKKIEPMDLLRGRRLVEDGRHQEAIAFFDSILEKNPTNLPAAHERFKALIAVGEKEKAAQAASVLAQRYIASDNLPMLENLLEEMDGEIDLDAQACFKLAYHCEQKWKNEQAVSFYLKAAGEKGLHTGKALLAAARILQKRLKDFEGAGNIYQRVLDELPGDPAAEIARREMEALNEKA